MCRIIVMRIFPALVLLALTLPAQAAAQCTELRHVHGYIAVMEFLGAPYIPTAIYEGDDAARITADYSQLKSTHIEADTVVTFEAVFAPRTVIVFALGDCLVAMLSFTVEESDRIILGDPS